MPFLQPNVTKTGNGVDMYLPVSTKGNVVIAGNMDVAGDATLNNVTCNTLEVDGVPVVGPVVSSSAVAYAGDVAGVFTIPLNSTANVLSAGLNVVAGHTYRVSGQLSFDNADTTSYTIVYVSGTGVNARMASIKNADSTTNAGQESDYSCLFTASTTAELFVRADNSSLTTATSIDASANTFWLVEDLGVIAP